MIENRINLEITPEDQTAVQQAVDTLKTILTPYLVSLLPEERKVLPKMGDKTLAFVTKANEHMTANPNLLPAYLDVDAMSTDLEAVEQLRQYLNPLAPIVTLLEDSKMLAGSEAYSAALSFYYSVKGATKNKVPGAEDIYNDLKIQFTGTSKKAVES